MPRNGRLPGPDDILPLTLEKVTFEAGGARLIDELSATLAAGPRTVILGPNGAGKSLLLRLCHGLLAPTGGRIRWNASDEKEISRGQAMVFQRPVLLRRTVLANVMQALAARGVPAAERRARARAALEEAELSNLAERPARVLSGGEQQRLALARARALRPRILFLDEPCANLDPAATQAVESRIEQASLEGTKIVMTTHNLGQARRLAEEILFLHRGRLLETAPAERFFDQPRSLEAKAFLAGELLI